MRINALSKVGMIYMNNDSMYRIIHSNDQYAKLINEEGELFDIKISELDYLGDMKIPSALINFAIVNLDNGHQDVLITVHRVRDLEQGIDKPFVIARQAVINIFRAPFVTELDKIPYGLAISNLTSMKEFNMEAMLECKEVELNRIISVYPNDTIYNMIYLLNHQDEDSFAAFNKIINEFSNTFKQTNNTLIDFLIDCNFIVEYNNAHGTIVLDGDYIICDEPSINQLLIHNSVEHVDYDYDVLVNKLEHILGYKIQILDMIEYTPIIDLKRLKSDRFLFVKNYEDSPNMFILKYLTGAKVMFIPSNQKLMYEELVNKVI